MSTLSVCSICQDEEDTIPWFLRCCKYLYDELGDLFKELVIVDGGSRDRTVEIIKSYSDEFPIILIEHPFDSFGEQKNRSLSLATGDFILGLDSDMTISKNFVEEFKSGRFQSHTFWDLMLVFTGGDAYHYYPWGINPNMRLWKRGPKFVTNFHEKLEGQSLDLSVCSNVFVFENSCRASDSALLNRGERYQKFVKEMIAEGQGPGPSDRYINAKKSNTHIPLPSHILNLVIEGT